MNGVFVSWFVGIGYVVCCVGNCVNVVDIYWRSSIWYLGDVYVIVGVRFWEIWFGDEKFEYIVKIGVVWWGEFRIFFWIEYVLEVYGVILWYEVEFKDYVICNWSCCNSV